MSDRFYASIKRGHQTTMSNVMGRLQAGSVFALTPQEFTDLSDLAGALNYWAAQSVPQAQFLGHIPAGDFSRKEFAPEAGQVVAYSFRMPAAGLLYASAAEYGGSPWLRSLSISPTSGDMDSAHGSVGKQATVYLAAGDFPADTLLYANMRIEEDAPPGTTGSGFSIVWPAP